MSKRKLEIEGSRFNINHTPNCVDKIMITADIYKKYVAYQKSYLTKVLEWMKIYIHVRKLIVEYYSEDPEIIDVLMLRHEYEYVSRDDEKKRRFRLTHFRNKRCPGKCNLESPCYALLLADTHGHMYHNETAFDTLLILPRTNEDGSESEYETRDPQIQYARDYLYRQLSRARK